MQIKKIHIENFRCFSELDITFEKCHALIGQNGAGKTTILEAINLVSSPAYAVSRLDEQDFHSADERESIKIEAEYNDFFVVKIPDGYGHIYIPSKKIRFEAWRRLKAANGKALSEPFVVEHTFVPVEYTAENKPMIAGTEIPSQVKQTRDGYEAPRKGGSNFKFTTRHLTMQNDVENMPTVFFFDKSREKETKVGFNSLFQRILKDLNWRYRKDCELTPTLEQWNTYYNPVINKVIDPKRDQLLNPIRNGLKELTGNSFDDLEISLLDIEQPFSKAFFAKRDKTNQILSQNLGSGISILIAYLLLETIALRSKTGLVILIDEPELHLHPQLQLKLFDHFYKSGHQVIYTTQSDAMVSLPNWRGISLLRSQMQAAPQHDNLQQNVEGKTISQHLDDIATYHHDKKVFRRDDNQIFFANKCLLVEGANDKYGLPIFAQLMNVNISDFTVVMCGGKANIKSYKTLCDAFEIPAFVVFDEDSTDERNRSYHEAENARLKSIADRSYFSFNTSFEKVISHELRIGERNLIAEISRVPPDDIPVEIQSCVRAIANWMPIEETATASAA